MTELKITHILMFVVAAFFLYHLLGSCGCGNGFSVGGLTECKPNSNQLCPDGKKCPECGNESCVCPGPDPDPDPESMCIMGEPCGKQNQEPCIGDNTDGWSPPSILTNCNVLLWNPSTETCQIPAAFNNKYITKKSKIKCPTGCGEPGDNISVNYNCKRPNNSSK